MSPSALIIGVGGLGCPAAVALVRAGVRTLTLMDPDRVDVSNLHRQLLYRAADVGRPKVEAAADRLRALEPSLTLRLTPERFVPAQAVLLFGGHSVVVDAVDGVATKLALSDAAVATRTPLVHAGAVRQEGQLMPVVPGGPCLRCLFEDGPDEDAIPTCAGAGVLGTVVGWVGALQGALAARIALGASGLAEPGAAHLTRFHPVTLTTRGVLVRRRADCDVCGEAGRARAPQEAHP